MSTRGGKKKKKKSGGGGGKYHVESGNDIEDEIRALNDRVRSEAPASGYVPPSNEVVSFASLPISRRTIRGLDDAKPTPFTSMTDIQRSCIPHALVGRDILGAARTGSGKTLAFLVPILERLFRDGVTTSDGPMAIVLSPTRELAVQIFHVLRTIGRYHVNIGVGLLIGGKRDFYLEQRNILTTNVVIATPGRLLQHLEQTPYLDVSELKMLVLDEADRILDMGFRQQLLNVLEYLPKPSKGEGAGADANRPGRQTLLFSATQTRDVSDLATLSLRKPEYIGVHDRERTSTPETLRQSYVVVPAQHKFDAVYSFVRSHLKCKSIVFMSSCSQVRYAWELFCSLRPGVPVMALHGRLAQGKRTQIYVDYTNRQHAVMFATDVAARGLDFPNIDWVVQMDAPENRDMYIHRVGRTARYRSNGKSLMILTPKEEQNGFVRLIQHGSPTLEKSDKSDNHHQQQKKKRGAGEDGGRDDATGKEATSSSKIPLKKLSINPTKTIVVSQRAAALAASNPTLQRLAKKAFRSYIRSVNLMPHGEIFRVRDIPLDEYSKSLGLASTPNIKFLQKAAAKDRAESRKAKNANKKLQKLKEQIKAEKLARKIARLGQQPPSAAAAASEKKRKTIVVDDDDSSDSEDDGGDDLLVSKRRPQERNDEEDESNLPESRVHEVSGSRRGKKIRIDGSNTSGKHVVFDEDGEAAEMKPDDDAASGKIRNDKEVLERATDEYVRKVQERLRGNIERDRIEEKDRIRQKHKKRRLQETDESGGGGNAAAEVTLLATAGSEDSASASSSDEEADSSTDDGTRSSDDDDDDDEESVESSEDEGDDNGGDVDIKTHEEMALSLIRRGL